MTQVNAAAELEFKEGCSLAEGGDLPAALNRYRAAIDLDDTDPRYWLGLGVALSKLRHWSEAVDALATGVALKPHYAEADARLFLADALIAAGHQKLALEQLEIISRMEPSYPSDDAKRRLTELTGS